jgi:hypothetical protein
MLKPGIVITGAGGKTVLHCLLDGKQRAISAMDL